MLTTIEERRGIIQKVVKFVSELILKLSRWIKPGPR